MRKPEMMEQARAAAEKVIERQAEGALTKRMMAAISAYGFANFESVSGLGV